MTVEKCASYCPELEINKKWAWLDQKSWHAHLWKHDYQGKPKFHWPVCHFGKKKFQDCVKRCESIIWWEWLIPLFTRLKNGNTIQLGNSFQNDVKHGNQHYIEPIIFFPRLALWDDNAVSGTTKIAFPDSTGVNSQWMIFNEPLN